MVRLVERRAYQVVHTGVRDDKRLVAVPLHVEHPGEQRAGLRDQEASRLKQQVKSQMAGGGQHLLGIRLYGRGRVKVNVGIFNAEPDAGIEVRQLHAILLQLLDQVGDTLERRSKWADITNLRADMHAHAGREQPLCPGGLAIDGACGLDVDAKLVSTQASRNIGVRLREDTRIYPQ